MFGDCPLKDLISSTVSPLYRFSSSSVLRYFYPLVEPFAFMVRAP
jgi:hypothetical protein